MSNSRSSSKVSTRRSLRLPPFVTGMLSPRKNDQKPLRDGFIVAFSGIFPSKEDEQFIFDNGGDVVSSDGIRKLPFITHLVVGDNLKPRRIKFLGGLCVAPETIVSYQWMEKSRLSNVFLPPDEFRITSHSAAENLHGFSLQSSYDKAIVARRDGGILHGRSVYVVPRGVMGGNGPSKDEVTALTEAAGGVYLKTVAALKKMIKNVGDCTKLIIITSDFTIPGDAINAIEMGATEMDWTSFVTALLNQDFGSTFNLAASQLPLIDDEHVIDVTQQAMAQVQDSTVVRQFVKILCVNLEVSPQRTISDASIGDPARAFLGPNGMFEVYKCVRTLETAVRYVDEEGTIMFESLVPPPEDCYKAIQGNAGRDICIMWDTCNTAFASGGTTVQGASNPSDAVAHRRHFFWFESCDELKLVLYHMLGNDRDLVDQFFTENSRFFASERTQPDHDVVKFDNAMDDDDIPLRTGYFGQATTSYDPRGQSQLY